MQTIKDQTYFETIVNKSKFITILVRLDDVNLVKETLNTYKEIYKNATHYCYAYIIGNNIKSSDDGEPNGTAGAPILNVLTKEHLNNVLCLIIRYYGGVLLGRGGLTRAYIKATTNLLNNSIKYELKEAFNITITFKYDLTSVIDHLLKDTIIIKKNFTSNVTYNFNLELEEYNKIANHLLKYTDTLYKKEKVFILK